LYTVKEKGGKEQSMYFYDRKGSRCTSSPNSMLFIRKKYNICERNTTTKTKKD